MDARQISKIDDLKKGYEKHCISQEGDCRHCKYNNDIENCIWVYIKKNLKDIQN